MALRPDADQKGGPVAAVPLVWWLCFAALQPHHSPSCTNGLGISSKPPVGATSMTAVPRHTCNSHRTVSDRMGGQCHASPAHDASGNTLTQGDKLLMLVWSQHVHENIVILHKTLWREGTTWDPFKSNA